jgi:hypothetical protein
MRTHIAKALQSRCKAIRNAVKTYNAAAAQLLPPRPPINWESISHINFLEEFNLLHDTRQDIRKKQWSQPAVRELMKLSQRVKRAHEEIDRCHIAIRRLYTAIYDENDFFRATLSRLQTGDPLVYSAVHDFTAHRQRVNDLLLSRLNALTSSSDYSGDSSRGVRAGSGSSGNGTDSPGQPPANVGSISNEHDGEEDNDEELDAEETDESVGQLIDYVSDLSLLQ